MVSVLGTLVLGVLSPLEHSFYTVPSNDSAAGHLYFITSEAHVAGTSGDHKMAKYVHDAFTRYGLDSHIEAVPVLLNYPVERSLELLDGSGRMTPLSEDAIAIDKTSDSWWRNHTFNGYGPSGDVTAPVVYANYGRPEDFAALARAGLDVRGKLVLARYGECFRGLKVMNAQQRGAVGMLIFSDPADDGEAKGPVYPTGPWRPPSGVQRGSVQFNSLCAGDPSRAYLNRTSLNRSATFEACGYEEADLVPSIPVLPLSYADAYPLLNDMRDSTPAPADFTGGLPLPAGYRLGPSEHPARLIVRNQEARRTPIWNVIGVIKGKDHGTELDRPVLLGNHRDAWVFGAVDPNSGTAAMLELARGLGALLAMGWVPRRSLILCSWSGEEYGLLGSTAYGEMNAAELAAKAVAYINVDEGVSGGELKVSATQALAKVIRAAAADVEDPRDGRSLLSHWGGEVGLLGSGSDYTVFLDHLGIASADMQLSGSYGVYHSVYDSFTWMATQGDPGFRFHVAMARLWGLVAIRLADTKALPFDHSEQASALAKQVVALQKRVTKAPVGMLHFEPLVSAVAKYASAAIDASSAENDVLAFTERRFLLPSGLPRRPWFKHVLQAPGLYLGYAALAFPGIAQAVDDGDWATADEQIQAAANAIRQAALFLGEVGGATPPQMAIA